MTSLPQPLPNAKKLGLVIDLDTCVLSALAGLLVERWLFFAEATHVSTLYYGR